MLQQNVFNDIRIIVCINNDFMKVFLYAYTYNVHAYTLYTRN